MKRFAALLLITFFAFSGSYASVYAQESLTNNQVAARDIMGDDIIFPEEIAKARGLTYTKAQLKQLSDTMPTAEVLRWGKDNGYALMPSPPKAMSVLNVSKLKPTLFLPRTGSLYDGEAFARNDKTTFGWLMIKKTPVENSMDKNWEEQNKLLSEVERVPNIAEMSWFITTFYEARRTRIFEEVTVRISSLDSDGNRVVVGAFATGGLYVDDGWDDLRNNVNGVASARKLP